MTGRNDNGARWLILLSAGLALSLTAAFALIFSYVRYRQARDLYSDAERTYVRSSVIPGVKTGDAGDTGDQDEPGLADEDLVNGVPWFELVSVDVDGLRKQHNETVGWIYFENEDISYPVMYSGDNSKYLHTAYTGERSASGAIFLDGASSPDLSDTYAIIYGHNMRDLSMFGKLKFYRTEEDYYDTHRYFQIFDGEKVYRYKIFAYAVVRPDHPMYRACGNETADIGAITERLRSESIDKTDVEISPSDRIITLSTCASGGKERMTVSAVRVATH